MYHKIAIKAKENFTKVSFEFHPNYTGKMSVLSGKMFMMQNNYPTPGVHELNYSDIAKLNMIQIKVCDIIEIDSYPSQKLAIRLVGL